MYCKSVTTCTDAIFVDKIGFCYTISYWRVSVINPLHYSALLPMKFCLSINTGCSLLPLFRKIELNPKMSFILYRCMSFLIPITWSYWILIVNWFRFKTNFIFHSLSLLHTKNEGFLNPPTSDEIVHAQVVRFQLLLSPRVTCCGGI